MAVNKKTVAPAAPGVEKKARKPVAPKLAFRGVDEPLLKSSDPRLLTYTRKTFKAIKPSDFESKAEAMRFQAMLFDRQAAGLRTNADRIERLGSIVDNKKAKRLMALTTQMEALKASLAADGEDIGALLASMGLAVA